MATLTQGQAARLNLKASQSITVTPSSAGQATVSANGPSNLVYEQKTIYSAETFGPYVADTVMNIAAVFGSLEYTDPYTLVPSFSTDSSGNVTGLVGLGADIGSNKLLIGTATQGSGKEIVQISEINTNANSVSRPTMVYFEQDISPSAGGTVDWHGLDVKASGGGSNANFSAASGFYAVEGKTQMTATAGQTVGRTVGIFGSSSMTGSSGTLSLSVGVQGETQQTGAGTTTAAAAFYAKAPTITAGTIATAYGLFIQDIAGATNNFAIQTNAGRVLFHSNVAPVAGGSFKVGVMMSSTNAFGIFFGSGAPTLSAAQGSLYMRTDGSSTSTRMYVNTNGTTGWTAVTTAA